MNTELLVDLYLGSKRLGPGSDASTEMALTLSGLKTLKHGLKVADIGCGTGASTRVLAQHLDADIYAVDLFEDFLHQLGRTLDGRAHLGRVHMQFADMQ